MKRRGLTTLELLVALSVTSITGLGVAMVITSVSRGITMMNDTRGAMQRASAAHVRMRAYTDTSLCLLEHDPLRGFALWAHDERPNGQVNASELRIFWMLPDKGEVCTEFVVYPEEMTPEERDAADLIVSTVDDPFEAMLIQRRLGYTQQLVLADGVASLSITHNENDPRDSERFRLLLGLEGTGGEEELLMALGLPEYRRPE